MTDTTTNSVDNVVALENGKTRCALCVFCNNPDHIGKPSVSQQMKVRWRNAKGFLTLKRFARQLAAQKDTMAVEFLAIKRGLKNQKRKPENIKRIIEEKMASKNARKKTKAPKAVKTV